MAWLVLGCHGVSCAEAGMMTVDFMAQPGQRLVVDGAGKAVSAGVHVWVGGLEGPLPTVVSCEAVSLLWQPFAGTVTRSLGNQPGRFSAAASREAPELSFQKMYLFIRETVGGAAPQADGANVVAWGLYSSGAAGWVFPDAEALAPGNATMINSSEVSEAWGGRVSANSLQLVAVGPSAAGAYAVWARGVFGEVGTERSAPLADPDRDGLANAWECFYGTSPLVAEGSPLTFFVEGRGMGLRFPQNAALPGGFVQVEVSDRLTGWAVPGAEEFSVVAEGGGMRYFFPEAGVRERFFVRLALPWLR